MLIGANKGEGGVLSIGIHWLSVRPAGRLVYGPTQVLQEWPGRSMPMCNREIVFAPLDFADDGAMVQVCPQVGSYWYPAQDPVTP